MSAYVLEAFDFKFDFSTTGLAVGNTAKVGGAAVYTVSGEGVDLASPLTLPSESFGEVAGIEIYPGLAANGMFEHLDYVKLIIGGQSHEDQVFNELTAPGLAPGSTDPLGASGLRHGIVPINFGLPMLMGGRPEESCPKIPPGKPIEIEVACPPAAEGGIALAQPLTVRLWMAKVNGVEKLKEVLKYNSMATGYGYYDGNVMNCNFNLGDMEVNEKMPVRTRITGNPIKNLIPEVGTFDPLDHWSKMPGGMDQDKPKSYVFSVFSKQMTATTANTWYQFTNYNQHSQDRMADLYWDFTRRDALQITHIGFKNPAVGVIDDLWLRRSGRELEQRYEVQRAKNPFPMPRTRSPADMRFTGPGKLLKPLLIWNEIGSIEMMDNGTSVTPWALVANDQAGIYARGIRYELNEKEV